MKSVFATCLFSIASGITTPQDQGKITDCHLVDLGQSGERNVFGATGPTLSTTPTSFDPTSSRSGFSIKCETDGNVDYVKYFFGDSQVLTHYSKPFWISGDGSGTWVNKFDYLTEACGQFVITAKSFTWVGGDNAPSSTRTLVLKSTKPCNPPPTMPPPTMPPPTMPPPTKAPPPTMPPPTMPPPTMPPPTNKPPPVPHPPSSPICYLSGSTLSFGISVSAGIVIEVSFGAHNAKWLTFNPGHGTSIYVNKYLFDGHQSGFYLRFYNPAGDVAGHWTWCKNYHPVGNNIVSLDKIPAQCYLWGDRLGYGAYVPTGTKIEVVTTDHKYFTYYTTRTDVNYLVTYTGASFDRRNFSLRIVYTNGYTTPYVKCKNFTPIGIDVDRSGDVETITGQFQIDITGDGQVNELTEWFAPTEGILINADIGIVNGKITGEHLFGDMGGTYADGFEKLLEHDADGDGHITGKELEGLAIWIDGDSNNILDEDELYTLEDHGIVGLSTFDTDFVAAAQLEDGGVMKMVDVWFLR